MVDQVNPADTTPAGVVARWVAEIALYERDAGDWHTRGRKIVKRYKDERTQAQESQARFNVLWSNVQTFLPACYGRNPKPEVERRFKDKDPVGRAAAEILERSLEHLISTCDFKQLVRGALLDRLLPGRGLLWVRYVPHMRDLAIASDAAVREEGAQLTDDALSQTKVQDAETETPPTQEVYFEEVVLDYVHWEDFGHTAARTIDEMGAAWRKVYLTRDELVRRFGEEIGKAVPLNYKPPTESKDTLTEAQCKGVVYEIWDKVAKQALWICKDYAARPLDTRDDPLKLSRFFPFPRAMYATLANDSLVPVPDYRQYQDQADELDNLTGRIDMLTRAVKVAGVHDASAPALARLLNEGVQNQLIGVDKWAAFAEKGGLKGAIELLPMQEIAETLLVLHEARDKVKEVLYEITGMPDIIRGANDPRSTATAERIKGQFGSIRLRDMQDDVQRFVRDLLNVAGEIIAGHFGWDTLAQISGVRLLTREQKAQAQAQQMAAQQAAASQPPQPGMPPQAAPMAPVPPLDPEVAKLLDEPCWEDVEALLRDNCARSFRIDIETDSTIGEDEQLEQESRLKMVETLGEFIAKAVEAAESTPQLAPVCAEMVMYVVRSFKNARTLEAALEEAMEKLVALAANPSPKPNPEMMKVQGQLQLIDKQAQTDSQQAQQKAGFDMQLQAKKLEDAQAIERFKASLAAQVDQAAQAAQAQQQALQQQLEAQRDAAQAQHEAQLQQLQAVLDTRSQQMDATLQLILAKLNNEAKVEVAEIAADTQLQSAQISAANQGTGDD